MKRKIKLLKKWLNTDDNKSYAAGTILEVDEATATELTEAKTAELYDADVEAKRVADEQKQQEWLKNMAVETVKNALGEFTKANKGSGINIIVAGKGDEEKGFESLGEQLIAIKNFHTSKGQDIDPRLLVNEAKTARARGKNIEGKAATGLNETVDSEGGVLVQTDFVSELYKQMFDTGILASRCQRVQIGAGSNGLTWNAVDETSRVDGSRRGGIQVYRTAEAGTKTASTTKFARREMRLEKMAGLFYATDELLEDSTALASMVTGFFGEEFGYKLDSEILSGTGAGQCLGILNSGALVSVAKETGQAAATLVAENLIKMYSRLSARSMPRAVWYINQDIIPQLFTMKITIGTGGQLVYMPANGLSQAPYGTLFGRPVQPIEQAETLGTKGDIILADLSEYLLIEKGGLKTDSSIHVRFVNDETAFRFVVRNNGQPKWRLPLTPAKGSATTSPFVSLDTRA